MFMTAIARPLSVGLMATALSVGGWVGAASAGPGSAAIPALTANAADDRGDRLIRVHDKKRHHRHKHHYRHHGGHHRGFHNEVVVIERHHPVPVYRERVVEHYYYVEPRRPYLVDLLTGGVIFVFSFD